MKQPPFVSRRVCAAAFLIALGMLGGCRDSREEANQANFTAAIRDFLAKRGHLCVAKYDWPIYVSAQDAAAGTRDARQMPVLEQVGLVESKEVMLERKDQDGKTIRAPGRAYALTAEGRKYYLHLPVDVASAPSRVTHPGDLCVASLSLDKVVGWETPVTQNGQRVSSVLYTYRIAPASWVRDPRVLRAFPMVARVIEGEGTMQLREGVHLTDAGWVADAVFPR